MRFDCAIIFRNNVRRGIATCQGGVKHAREKTAEKEKKSLKAAISDFAKIDELENLVSRFYYVRFIFFIMSSIFKFLKCIVETALLASLNPRRKPINLVGRISVFCCLVNEKAIAKYFYCI